jgi:hypothetical protein
MASYGGGSSMQVMQGTNHRYVGWQASHSQLSILGEFSKHRNLFSFRALCKPFFVIVVRKFTQKKKRKNPFAQDTLQKSCNYEKVLEKQHV